MDYKAITYLTILAVFLIIVTFWVVMEMKYKNTVIVREWVNGRKRILKRRAKEYLDKHKILWWRITKENDPIKKNLPPPPPEAIDMTHKGKKWAECYRTEQGEVIWINDSAELVSDVPYTIYDGIDDMFNDIRDYHEREFKIQIERQNRLNAWLKENNKVRPFQPLTTNQRVALITSITNAEMRKSTTIWDTINKFGIPAIFVLTLMILLVFWGEIAAPVLEAQREGTLQMQIQQESLKILKGIKDDVQVIKGEDIG